MSRIYDALKKAEDEQVTASATSKPENGAYALEIDGVVSVWNGEEFAVREWNPDPARLVLMQPAEHVAAIEQFRSLRSRLYQLRSKKPMKSILVCSAVAGEGKTFVASNLATALAMQQGRGIKILLIDGDLRNPGLHELFGAQPEPGLAEYLAGDAEIRDIVQAGPVDNLWLIPGGVATSEAAERLNGKRFSSLLEEMAPTFDWILMDSSPVLPVSDAVIISRSADAVLLVARAAGTTYDLVQQAQHEFRDSRVLGLVLNAANEQRHRDSYYYPGYGYGQPGKPKTTLPSRSATGR